MSLSKLSLELPLASALALGLFATSAHSQTGSAVAERCSTFNALSERHGNSAREITAKAQEQAKSMPAADAAKFLAANEAGAKSEWEMSALARDAYRKCIQDYLAGGSAAPRTPAAPAPAQKQAVQQPARQQAVQKPAQQARPKKTQQQTQQQPRVQKKPDAEQAQRAQQEQPEETYRPLLPGLFNLGIGIGLGGLAKP